MTTMTKEMHHSRGDAVVSYAIALAVLLLGVTMYFGGYTYLSDRLAIFATRILLPTSISDVKMAYASSGGDYGSGNMYSAIKLFRSYPTFLATPDDTNQNFSLRIVGGRMAYTGNTGNFDVVFTGYRQDRCALTAVLDLGQSITRINGTDYPGVPTTTQAATSCVTGVTNTIAFRNE
jgi:hypothetical protein